MSNLNEPTVFLGFDFGLSKIGVAVGQLITQSATPLVALKATNGQPNWQHVQNLIDEWHVEACVVGLPYNMDGSVQELLLLSQRFARRLEGRFMLPVYCVDERLTTKDAQQQLLMQRGKISKIKRGEIDSYAAKLILETYFRGE